MNDLDRIDSKNIKMRIILIAFGVIVIVSAAFAIRWQFGNMLSVLTRPGDPDAEAIAQFAANWSPSDPAAYSLRADTGDNPEQTVLFREQAVLRAPSDYRLRIELGRAYEQNDDAERAEQEFRKAVELAPSYASVHWHLGNYLLRRERNSEALAELRKAAENNHIYRDQVFSLAWDSFDKDALQVELLVSDRPESWAHLAYFLAARGRAEDSLRIWNKLTDAEKIKKQTVAESIAAGLFDQRHYRQALEFSKQFGAESDAVPEQVTNGSFEKNIDTADDERFGWQIVRNDPKLEIATDNRVTHTGGRSLRLLFKGFSKPALANLFQTVVVNPNKKYQLRFWVRTENLKSAGAPMIEIVDVNNENKTLARSQTFSDGTNDWQQFSMDFVTPDNCGGISLRTIRAFCGEGCPITGILWYDDFVMDPR